MWFYALAFLGVLFLSPIVLCFTFNDNHYKYAYQIIRFWSKFVFYGSGFSLNFIQTEKLDINQQYIIIANHTSVLDILLMYMIHPQHQLTFVGKKELKKLPLFGQIYQRTCILVDRKSAKSRAKVYELVHQKILLKRNVIIFPEGGVPDDTKIKLDEFKDGAFSIAKSQQLPIAVYIIKGLKESFPFDFFKGFPSKIEVKLIDVISIDEVNSVIKHELKESIRTKMLENLT
jgi:1-acyl-sn-glycerol-3-phosphate acyltransferase